MKKYTSVMMLYARSTICKLLGLLAVTGLAEVGLFYMSMSPESSLEAVFSASHLPLVCGVAFLLWTAVLIIHPLQKSGYTLYRMQLRPVDLFLCHIIYNTCCYVLFWSFQACLLLGLFHWYGAQANEAAYGPQSIMLAFYRTNFLHSLLPLADWTRYVRNAFLALGLGTAAALPLARQGSRSSLISLAVLALAAVWSFPASIGRTGADWTIVVISVLVVLWDICTIAAIETPLSSEDVPNTAAVSRQENEVNRNDTNQ